MQTSRHVGGRACERAGVGRQGKQAEQDKAQQTEQVGQAGMQKAPEISGDVT